jgi:hypothetical protein
MTRRRRFLALVCTLFAFPALATGQSPYAPSIPPAGQNPYAASTPLAGQSPYAASTPSGSQNPYAASTPPAGQSPYGSWTPPSGQNPYTPSTPPIPTGPPLDLPPSDVRKATWLEDAPPVRTPGGLATINDAGWPGGQAASACNFDCPNGESHWMTGQPSWCQVLAGAYYSSGVGPTIPTFNYIPVSVRQGWYIGNPFGPNWLGTGYWEFVGDLTGAAITSDYGSWFAGMSIMWRYNCVDYGNPVVPYIQFGAGGILNDAYKDPTQNAIGEKFEFYLHVELGLKFFISPNLSLDIEGGFQHISNAGLASRNYGVNAFGGQVGFTYYFPWGCH